MTLSIDELIELPVAGSTVWNRTTSLPSRRPAHSLWIHDLSDQRKRDGELPGALCVDRNVLEWRFDPASTHRIDATGYDRRIIVVCNEGYSSSLAASTLP